MDHIGQFLFLGKSGPISFPCNGVLADRVCRPNAVLMRVKIQDQDLAAVQLLFSPTKKPQRRDMAFNRMVKIQRTFFFYRRAGKPISFISVAFVLINDNRDLLTVPV